MGVLTHQPLTEAGLEATYQAAGAAGDTTAATEHVYLHVRVDASGDETQTLTFAPVPSGGTFKLEFDNGTTTEKTAAITYSAGLTAAAIEAALEALALINPADVSVSGPNGGPTFSITFAGQYAASDVIELAVTDATFTGGGVATVSELTGGVGEGGITVSVKAETACNLGFFHDRNVAVPAGEERFIGPFPRFYWDNSNIINIEYSSVNGVTVAALDPDAA